MAKNKTKTETENENNNVRQHKKKVCRNGH